MPKSMARRYFAIDDDSSPCDADGSEIGSRGTAEWRFNKAMIWCLAFRDPRSVYFPEC
jgi:hypothetical protein